MTDRLVVIPDGAVDFSEPRSGVRKLGTLVPVDRHEIHRAENGVPIGVNVIGRDLVFRPAKVDQGMDLSPVEPEGVHQPQVFDAMVPAPREPQPTGARFSTREALLSTGATS